MDGPSPVLLLLFVVGGEDDETVVVVTDAEDGCGGLIGRIDEDMMLSTYLGKYSTWDCHVIDRDLSKCYSPK